MSGSPRRNTPSGGDPGGAFSRQRTSSDVNRTNDGGNLPPGVSPLRYRRSLDRGSRMLQVHAPVLASARYEKDGKLPPLNFRSPPTRHEQRRDDSDIGPETVNLPPLNSPTSSASSRRPPQPGLPTTEHERRCETAERLRRLGIDPDTARRLQTFSPEQVEVGAGHVLAVLWPEGTSEGGRKKGSTLQELQDEIERCRIANEEMKRAVNDERERYGATIRDLKLLCLTQDDAEVARTQSRLRQYHGLRQTLAEKSPVPDSAAAESDRFVLDQIAMLNAELELALAEKQAQKQKRSLNGLRGQPLTVDNRGWRSTWAQKAGQRFAPEMESPGLHQELLISVTTLQQENQRLYEENVQIRRALAAHGKATGTSQGPAGALLSGPAPPARHPLVPRATERAAPIPKVSDGYPLRSRRAPGGRACMSQWSKLLRGRDGEDRILSEAKLRRFLEQEGAVLSPSFSQADIAKSLLIVYRNTHEKMKYYRSRNRVLQTKLSKQRRRVPDSRKRQDGKEVDIGDEAFSLEWKVGTLEAEISRLRRSLELSTGTCLSLATIHNFFLEQKAILQRQLEGERADIESLEDECSTMKEMRLLCFAEEEENAEAGGDILNSLVGEAEETGHQTRRGTGLSGRSDGVEEAFLAAYEAVMNAVEALKTRHAQTAARLAQIQTGLISVEQDLKILDREQRSQLEKHMQDLADRGAESEGGGAWTRKPCYVRQAIGPGSADREAQTDNSGIASRRHLYTGDFPVSDSTTALVTVSIINEEDVVVKLMLEDMEFPLCLYTAIAAIRFPEGSRTGEGGASSEKGGHMSRLAKEGGTSPLSESARRETRRNVVKRRRLADETDGKLIATMLEVECVRGSPCLILKDQQEPAAPSQEPRPFISYVEDCLYNDKLSFDHVLLVCGTPLSLIMIQCAKRRYGMMFFHLCMYNNLSGWVKYVSLPSKEICRRFGHSGDRQLLEALGGLKRSGKVAETATVGTLIKLFEESFASDAKAAATSASASPSSRPFEPEVLVLCGSLTLGEKSEILKEQKLQAAKLKQTSRKSKRLDAQRTPLGLDASLSVSMQDYSVARTTSALGLNSSPFAEEKPDEAFVFLQLKICIDWDGYLDVSFEFEN